MATATTTPSSQRYTRASGNSLLNEILAGNAFVDRWQAENLARRRQQQAAAAQAAAEQQAAAGRAFTGQTYPGYAHVNAPAIDDSGALRTQPGFWATAARSRPAYGPNPALAQDSRLGDERAMQGALTAAMHNRAQQAEASQLADWNAKTADVNARAEQLLDSSPWGLARSLAPKNGPMVADPEARKQIAQRVAGYVQQRASNMANAALRAQQSRLAREMRLGKPVPVGGNPLLQAIVSTPQGASMAVDLAKLDAERSYRDAATGLQREQLAQQGLQHGAELASRERVAQFGAMPALAQLANDQRQGMVNAAQLILSAVPENDRPGILNAIGPMLFGAQPSMQPNLSAGQPGAAPVQPASLGSTAPAPAPFSLPEPDPLSGYRADLPAVDLLKAVVTSGQDYASNPQRLGALRKSLAKRGLTTDKLAGMLEDTDPTRWNAWQRFWSEGPYYPELRPEPGTALRWVSDTFKPRYESEGETKARQNMIALLKALLGET